MTNISSVNFTFNKNIKMISRVLELFDSPGFKVMDLSFKHLQELNVNMMNLSKNMKSQV